MDTIVHNEEFKADILKIDTDGFDFKVIRGANRIIMNDKPIIYFEWYDRALIRNNEEPFTIFPYLYQAGYENALLFDNCGNPFSIFKTTDIKAFEYAMNYTKNSNIGYYDVCLIHKDSEISIYELYDYVNKKIE